MATADRKRPADLSVLYSRLTDQTREPSTIEQRIRNLTELREALPYFDASGRDGIESVLAETLKISQERAVELLKLLAPEEIRRALRFVPDREHHRLEGESIYPRDGWLGAYLLYCQGMEVPLGWHFWSSIAVLGASLRRHVYLDMNSFYLWPNIYVALIGPSGEGKSAAINVAIDLVTRVNRTFEAKGFVEWKRLRTTPQRCTPEKFIHLIRSEMVFDHEVTTGFVTEKHSDSTALVIADEVVTLLGKSTFHSEQWIHLLTALYTCPVEWDASTIGRGNDKLRNVAISALFGSTPDWIRNSVTEDMFHGGFMGRCIFVPRDSAKRDYPLPDILDPITANYLAAHLVSITEGEPFEFTGSSAWWDAHHELHLETRRQAESSDHTMRGYYNRKVVHTLKLAMLMALSEGRRTGEDSDVTHALRIVEFEEMRLPECFSEMAAHKTSLLGDYALKAILKLGGRCDHSTLFRRIGKRIGSAHDMEIIMRTLAQQKRVRILQPSGPRKAVEYEVLASEQALGDD